MQSNKNVIKRIADACMTVNMLLLISIALTALCGMSMSSYAVPFLYGMVDIAFAETGFRLI